MVSPTAIVVRSGPEKEDDDGGVGETTRNEKEFTAEDLIVQILARLPVKSLLRFKCVSKYWYNIILSPNLISMHNTYSHRNNKNVTLGVMHNFTFQIGEEPVQELTFNHCNMKKGCFLLKRKTEGCFNGVVCISTSLCPQTYALWNPATRQVREIGDCPMEGPSPTDPDFSQKMNGSYCSGFCFDPVKNSFMVTQIQLACSTEAAEGTSRAQVNVFSTATNSWTEKTMTVPYQFGVFDVLQSVTCVNGYVHWHIIRPEYILSYDIINEAFGRMEMPYYDFANFHIMAHRETLAVITGSSSGYDLWVMSDCGGPNQSWSKLLTFQAPISVLHAVGFFRKDDVDFMLYEGPNNTLYAYDPVNGDTKKFWKREFFLQTFPYCETFASLY